MDESNVMIAAPIVAGLVEAAKKGGLPTNYAGSAAIVFAFAVCTLLVDDPTSLTAAGLYSQAKHYADEFGLTEKAEA